MTITASTKLPDRDVDRMVKEAQQFAADDEKRKEEATARNEADSLIYTAEKTIADLGEKIPADLKEKIGSAVKAARSALEGKDIQRIKDETAALQKVLAEAGSAIYQEAQKKQAEEQARAGGSQAGEGSGESSGQGGPSGNEKVV